MRVILSLTISLLLSIPSIISGQLAPERQWNGYRGYLASGVLDDAGLPDSFDFQKMENVGWR